MKRPVVVHHYFGQDINVVAILKLSIFLLIPGILIPTGIPRHAEAGTAKQRIVLVTPKLMNSPDARFLQLVYTEAFRRLGIEFVAETHPAKRASLLSDTGKVGGELSRIFSYGDKHPTVLRVEEPHWRSGFLAFAADSSIHLAGWDSLKGSTYMVNYRRGVKGLETNLPRVVPPEQLETVTEIAQGFRKILAGRADIMVIAEMSGMSLLHSEEFKNSRILVVGVLDTFTSHVFLHEQHKALVPKLSEVLKTMKAEGLFSDYAKTVRMSRYFTE